MIPKLHYWLVLALMLSVTHASAASSAGGTPARTLKVGVGTSLTFGQIIARAILFLTSAISAVAVAMFIVGAFMITLSGVKEDLKERGKNLMVGAVISLAIVGGAYAMLRMVDYFLS